MHDTMKYFANGQEKNKFEAQNNKSTSYNNNEDEPVKSFLYEPTIEEIKRPKIAIPIPVKQINEDYHIKKLKELNNKKKKLHPKNNNKNFMHQYNLFFGLTEENGNNVGEKNENIFFNIDKFGQDNNLLFPIKDQKEDKKDNINDINNIYSNKNRSSKNLLNIMQYKNIIDEKQNLDENIQKVDSIDNFEKDINNCEQKLFH
jgi:hypothetical protein